MIAMLAALSVWMPVTILIRFLLAIELTSDMIVEKIPRHM